MDVSCLVGGQFRLYIAQDICGRKSLLIKCMLTYLEVLDASGVKVYAIKADNLVNNISFIKVIQSK